MKEILSFALPFMPNYFHVGDLLGDGAGGIVATSQNCDVVLCYGNAGERLWVHRNDADIDAAGGWPSIPFDDAGSIIPVSQSTYGSWAYRYDDPILARNPWGGTIWSNAFILGDGTVLCWRYRLRLLDAATGAVVREREFRVPGSDSPDAIGCAEVGTIGGQTVFFVSTLHAGLFCVNSRFETLWHIPDIPPVVHRGFVGDIDGDGNDEFFGGTTGYLDPRLAWGWGPEAWCLLVDDDGAVLWRKQIGPGRDIDMSDNHLDWAAIRRDRVILSDGFVFDARGELVWDARQHIHGHLQICWTTPETDDYLIYFTSREPALVAQFSAHGRLQWAYDGFRTKRLHQGWLIDYRGSGRRDYVVEELPDQNLGEVRDGTPDSSPRPRTVVLGPDGSLLDVIHESGFAQSFDWDGDGADELVLMDNSMGFHIYAHSG